MAFHWMKLRLMVQLNQLKAETLEAKALVAEVSGELVTTGFPSCDGALVTVAPSEGAGVITCSFVAGSSA